MRPALLTLLLLASLPSLPQTPDSSRPEGAISGTVLDEHGQPFKGVEVCTYMMGAPSGSKEAIGGCPVTTDEAGQFRIDHVAMGTFGVEAVKPEDGYVAIAGTSAREMVTLTTSQSSATVVLKLGPKPGVLLPSVKDKFTGKLVTDFLVSWAFLYTDQPGSGSSGGQIISQGTRRTIVPPEKYLVVTISADGYKKWFYHDPSDPSLPAFIRLQPGEEKELRVELEPQEPQAKDQTDLDAKPGVLLPSVKDKFTEKPLTDFEVGWEFLLPDLPGSASGGQTFIKGVTRAIVPPEKYLVVTIFARGYKKWFYHDPSDPSLPAFIRLQPGEEKELLVELEPQAPAPR